MTFTAVKLVQDTNFCVDRKSHREEKRGQRKICTPTTDRPTDRPTTDARIHDSNTPLGFQPEG